MGKSQFTVGKSEYQSDDALCRVFAPVRVDADRILVMLNGAWFRRGVFLHEEMKRFVNEKLAEVVGGPVAYFCREENDLDIFRQ